jgi:hypothetical protein
MGLGDKFTEMRNKAQAAVAERKEQITETVENVAVAVDEKTGYKHTSQIQKFGEKANSMVDKLQSPGDAGEAGTEPGAATTEDAAATAEPAAAAVADPPSEDAPAPAPPEDKAPTFGEPPSFDE